jgi:hypothetical protein
LVRNPPPTINSSLTLFRTHKDLKNAYKKFREHIPHKRRPLAEILKQLLQEIENEYTPEVRTQRFIPSPDAVNISTQEPSPAATPFEQQLFQMVTAANTSGMDTVAPVAPVAPVSPVVPVAPIAPVAPMGPSAMVDPSLMEQGMVVELQLVAGAALNVHEEAEDENDRELGKRLRGFIDENMTLPPEA